MDASAVETSAALLSELGRAEALVAESARPMPDPETSVLLVDLGALYAHAWYSTNGEALALEPDAPANAALGRVRRWAQTFPKIAICCDSPTNWRRERYHAYKATRGAKPDGYGAQLRRTVDILDRAGFPVWMVDGAEADDVMASAAIWLEANTDETPIIASADKDLCQMVNERTIVLNTRTSEYWGPAQVFDRFRVRPDQIREYLTLVGDTSDNVPGVPGIGEKGAAALLGKYGNLAAIITAAEAGALKAKACESILASRETIDLAFELVGLRTDLEIPYSDVLQGRIHAPDADDSIAETPHETEDAPASGPQVIEAPQEENQAKETTMANVSPITTAHATSAPKASKFQVVTGAVRQPHAFILTGQSGIGKTYLASTIPNRFFICVESGLKGASPDHIEDLPRFEGPSTIEEFHQMIAEFAIISKEHRFRHLVVDSMSGIERLVNMSACQCESVAHMEAKEFRRVWTCAIPIWQRVQAAFDRIRSMGIHVWVISHSMPATESVAETGETFTKHDLAFQGTGKSLLEIRQLWRGWADHVLFIDWDATVKASSSIGKKSVGQYRARIIRARETPQCFAKSRADLPERLAATWRDLEFALRNGSPASDAKLRAQIEALLAKLPESERTEIADSAQKAKSPAALSAVLSRAKGLISAARDDEQEDVPPTPPVDE